MQCSNCQRENESTNRFCIFCGSPLLVAEVEGPSEPDLGHMDVPPKQMQAVEEEVRSLREIVALMNERLATLESSQGITVPSEPIPTPAEAIPGPEAPAVPSLEVPPLPQVPPSPPRRVKPPRVKEREWEQILGGNWLARIGVLAIIIGVAFFLKFAFDNNWIGETGRIILGIIAGLAMLGGGYRWHRRYPVLAQALSGGGIAVLYLSIFAAFAIYQLISLYPAFGFLFLISIASAGLAIWYNTIALAVLGILGAFIAPSILTVSPAAIPASVQAGQSVWLLFYITAVDIGVLALSTFRNWRWFTLLALIGSLAIYGAWYNQFGYGAGLMTSLGSLALIFLIFVGATTLFHVIWRRAPRDFDQALMVINAAAYFGISLGLLWNDYRLWTGGFTLLLALFYGGLGYIALRRSADNVRLSFIALIIALVLVTAAIPVQLGNSTWTTIAWAAEGTILIWLSFTVRMPRLRWYSYAVFTIMAVRLLFFDTIVSVRTFQPILNERFLAFLISIAALYLAGYLLVRERQTLIRGEVAVAVFLIAANFFSLWLLSAEALDYFGSRIAALQYPAEIALRSSLRSAQTLSLTAIWAVYAIILLVLGIKNRWRPVRLGALALLAVAIGKVFIYDVFTLDLLYRIIAFIGLGCLLLASAYLYHRYSQKIKGFLVEK